MADDNQVPERTNSAPRLSPGQGNQRWRRRYLKRWGTAGVPPGLRVQGAAIVAAAVSRRKNYGHPLPLSRTDVRRQPDRAAGSGQFGGCCNGGRRGAGAEQTSPKAGFKVSHQGGLTRTLARECALVCHMREGGRHPTSAVGCRAGEHVADGILVRSGDDTGYDPRGSCSASWRHPCRSIHDDDMFWRRGEHGGL